MSTSTHISSYSKEKPYIAKIKERILLSKAGSTKKTYHISLDLSHSGITFSPGDAVAILPKNNPHLVENLISFLPPSFQNDENFDFLTRRANLSKISPKLYRALQLEKKEGYDVPLLLKEHRLPEESDLSQLFLPLLPRFYSIASSQLASPNQVDLLVASLSYQIGGEERAGVGSDFLCQQSEEVPLYIHPAPQFKLPQEDRNLILIGPGTGVAPYRAFMQERKALGTRAHHLLFFGERNRSTDYYYEDYWSELENQGILTSHCAFSRDQAEKRYVQHLLQEEGSTIWKWVEEGAYIYLCGDAKAMAKDVMRTLEEIFESHGNCDGKELLKTLRREKRFQSDVY